MCQDAVTVKNGNILCREKLLYGLCFVSLSNSLSTKLGLPFFCLSSLYLFLCNSLCHGNNFCLFLPLDRACPLVKVCCHMPLDVHICFYESQASTQSLSLPQHLKYGCTNLSILTCLTLCIPHLV